MEISAEELKELWERDPEHLANALASVLQDFGYTSCTKQYVKVEIQRLYDGGSPQGGPSMFLAEWIEGGISQ